MNRLKLFMTTMAMLILGITSTWAADSSKPAQSTIDQMLFPNGSYVGKLVFTMPTKTANGTNISEQLTYQVYLGTSYASLANLTNFFLLGEGSASAGEQLTIDNINIKDYYPTRDNFSVTFTVYAFNSAGNSFKYSAVFVGYADPDIPTNIQSSVNAETRELTLSWDAPTEPRNKNIGGYIDVDGLTYTIVRYPGALTTWEYGTRFDPIEVATEISGTTFTDVLPDDPYTGYSYRITAINHGQTSVPYYGYSDTIKVGKPWEVPYLDTFDDSYQFNRYEAEIYKEGNTQCSWWSQNGCIHTRGTQSGNDADYWLISPPINLHEGNLYETGLDARLSAKRTHATLTIAVGQGDDPSTYQVVAENVNVPWIDEFTYNKVSGSFTVPTSGTYHVAIHDVTDRLSNNYGLVADNLYVNLLSSTAAPDSVSNLAVTPGEKGALSATVSFNAPSVNTEGETISSLEKIEVYRKVGDTSTLVETLSNPVPGQAYTVTDNSPSHDYNTYIVDVYNGSGKGLSNEQTKYIGPDSPQEIPSVQLIDMHNAAQQMKLIWEPVSTVGVHGGYVDPEGIDYNVYIRADNASSVGPLQVTQKNTELTISGVKIAEGDPSFMWYYVEAVNSEGKTSQKVSNTLVCGDPYPLPFIESYPNGQALYYWWYGLERPDDYDNETGYAFTLDGYHGVGKEMGCASWKSNNNGERGTLRSCKIAMNGVVHPAMEMEIRYEGQQQPIITVEVEDQTGEAAKKAYTFEGEMTSGDKYWTHVTFDLSDFRNSSYILLNVAVETPVSGTVFYVDNIRVFDLLDYDIETTIENTLTSVKPNVPTVFKVHAKNLGLNTNNRWKMNLVANGEIVDTKQGQTMEMLEELIIPMTYTPKVNDPEDIELYAELDWSAYDLNEDNDRSAIIDLKLLSSDLNAIDDLAATTNDSHSQVTLTWSTPDNAKTVTDDFESYSAWQETFGNWTSLDVDGVVNFVPGTWTYPWMGKSFGWGLFDITDVVSPIGSSLTTNSGNQCAVAMSTAMNTATKTYPPSDDWLISPLLSGKAQTISFYVRDYSSSTFAATMEVLGSKTGKEPADFTLIKDYPKGMIPYNVYGDFFEQKIDLPEGTKYFAIRNTSSNSFCIMVDDVTYEAGGGEIVGYNIYQDGNLISTINNGDATSATIDQDDDHSYNVSVIYAEGESSLSNTVETATTAIETIGRELSTESERYNISGQRITDAQHGINIIRYSDGTTRKVVVK